MHARTHAQAHSLVAVGVEQGHVKALQIMRGCCITQPRQHAAQDVTCTHKSDTNHSFGIAIMCPFAATCATANTDEAHTNTQVLACIHTNNVLI